MIVMVIIINDSYQIRIMTLALKAPQNKHHTLSQKKWFLWKKKWVYIVIDILCIALNKFHLVFTQFQHF